jgi:hypothetical protein
MIRGGILAVLTILEWASGVFAASISSLLFFLFAVMFGIAAPAVVFSGFTSPAWWLLFGSALTTTAVRTLTLAPIDRRLLEPALLSAEEIACSTAITRAFAMSSCRLPRHRHDALDDHTADPSPTSGPKLPSKSLSKVAHAKLALEALH